MLQVATCPVEDCKSTIDIVLKSSDGELFGAHQRDLEIYTEGFPTAGSTVASDPVPLEESAEVLSLLLKYTHRIRQPSLDDIPFTLLASLAEAVEKYMIYSAMEICKLKMMLAASSFPEEVFFYSSKHNYPALANTAAKSTLSNSPTEFLVRIREAGLHDAVGFRWLRYRDRWLEVLIQLVLIEPTFQSALHKGGLESCPEWPPFQFDVITHVSKDPGRLGAFSTVVDLYIDKLDDCYICRLRSKNWVSLVRERVNNLPEYSDA